MSAEKHQEFCDKCDAVSLALTKADVAIVKASLNASSADFAGDTVNPKVVAHIVKAEDCIAEAKAILGIAPTAARPRGLPQPSMN